MIIIKRDRLKVNEENLLDIYCGIFLEEFHKVFKGFKKEYIDKICKEVSYGYYTLLFNLFEKDKDIIKKKSIKDYEKFYDRYKNFLKFKLEELSDKDLSITLENDKDFINFIKFLNFGNSYTYRLGIIDKTNKKFEEVIYA